MMAASEEIRTEAARLLKDSRRLQELLYNDEFLEACMFLKFSASVFTAHLASGKLEFLHKNFVPNLLKLLELVAQYHEK